MLFPQVRRQGCDATRHGSQLLSVLCRLGSLQIAEVLRHIDHAPNFSGRTPRTVEKSRKICARDPFKPLGYVVHDRNCRTLDLISELPVFSGRRRHSEICIDVGDEYTRILPNPQILK